MASCKRGVDGDAVRTESSKPELRAKTILQFANDIDGNAVGTEVIGVQAA